MVNHQQVTSEHRGKRWAAQVNISPLWCYIKSFQLPVCLSCVHICVCSCMSVFVKAKLSFGHFGKSRLCPINPSSSGKKTEWTIPPKINTGISVFKELVTWKSVSLAHRLGMEENTLQISTLFLNTV